ncbi:hypothetical protein [Krasilnikovia sp. MM14-A1259]|uniref:hypothetical protein n=1 Tax=Krasilnikovia sp. MM14-A1259 TaxID=3373539 RepID=UPI00381633B4
MADMVDELWAWLHPALHAMKEHRRTEPGATWLETRARLLADLGLADADWHPVTRRLFERLDGLPDDDRERLIGGDDLDQVASEVVREVAAAGEPAATGAAGGYDEAAWHAFAIASLPYWNGTNEGWAPFAQWFAHHGAAQGLGAPATGFIEHAEPMSVDQRVALFAQYGVAVPVGAGASGAADGDQAAAGAGHVLDEDTQAVLDEVMAANPSFAQIPEARRMQLVAHVLHHHENA